MKAFPFLTFYLTIIQIVNCDVLEAVTEILESENVSCFTAKSDSNSQQQILFESYFMNDDLFASRYECLDHSVLFINGVKEFDDENLTQFRMYVIVNSAKNEEPKEINLNNIVWLQKVGNDFYSIYEKKRGKMEKSFIWNGNSFLDVNSLKETSFSRYMKGEVIRIGSTVYPPHTYFETDNEGRLMKAAGVEV